MRKNRIKLKSLVSSRHHCRCYLSSPTSIDEIFAQVKRCPRSCFLILSFFSDSFRRGEIPYFLTLKDFIYSYPTEIIDFLTYHDGKGFIDSKDFLFFDDVIDIAELMLISNYGRGGEATGKRKSNAAKRKVNSHYSHISVYTSLYAFFPEYGLSSDIIFITPDFLHAALSYFRGEKTCTVSSRGDVFNVIACQFLDKDAWSYELNWNFFVSLADFFSTMGDDLVDFLPSTSVSLANFLHRQDSKRREYRERGKHGEYGKEEEKLSLKKIEDFYQLAKIIDLLPPPPYYGSIVDYDNLITSSFNLSLNHKE